MFKFLAVYENFTNPFKDGADIKFGEALLIALVSILIVFVVLCIIIGAIKLLQKALEKFSKDEAKVAPKAEASAPVASSPVANVEIEDDDMMAAVLVATIDLANENASKGINKDIKLKSVKRIG